MIHAALFANPQNSRYRKEQFDLHAGEEGHETLDRPVVAQFCANDPDTFLQAATRLAESGQVDAVDLNLVGDCGEMGSTCSHPARLSGTLCRAARKALQSEGSTAPFSWKTGD